MSSYAQMMPVIILRGSYAALDRLAELDIEIAETLRKTLGAVSAHVKEESKRRGIDIENPTRYNVVENTSLEENQNGKNTGISLVRQEGTVRSSGSGRSGVDGTTEVYGGERDGFNDDGQDMGESPQGFRYDSEGRRVELSLLEELEDSGIKDKDGSPIAVYHFTPEMQFFEFAEGDIGFHFGTTEQAFRQQDNQGDNQGTVP